MKLLWTSEAEADRGAIYDYIEPDNPRAAVELDERFERRAAQLMAYPLIGRRGRVGSTRELVVRPNYLLVYDRARYCPHPSRASCRATMAARKAVDLGPSNASLLDTQSHARGITRIRIVAII